MTFLWPHLLWLFVLVPLLAAAYVMTLRRQKRNALRYASLKLVRDAMSKGSTFRRHLPPLLFLVALAAMLVAMARPAAVVRLPSQHETVVLSIDVSGSMKANDVSPDRMTAAREAARAFVAEQPRRTKIGIVEFSGTASLVHSPTDNRMDIAGALDRLQPQLSTAIGSGILVALKAVFPEAVLNPQTGKPAVAPDAVLPGSYKSAAIILLSDGESNAGPDPLEVAHTAAEFGVRVFTVGLGTPGGAVIQGEGWSMRVHLDEKTLKSIAQITGGEYFHARTAPDLRKVYETLNAKLTFERRETEITALFAALAALMAIFAGGLSLAWFNRLL